MDSIPVGHGDVQRLCTALVLGLGALALWPAAGRAVTVGAPLDAPANTQNGGGCEQLVLVGAPPPSCTLLGNDTAGGWTSQRRLGFRIVRR
jgi:hypothetical protein